MEIEKEKSSTNVWSILVITFLVIGGLYLLSNMFKPKWSLMICETVMENGLDCYDNAAILEDSYNDKESCLSGGFSFIGTGKTYPSFECGSGCRHEGVLMVCDEVCNRLGYCSK